MKTAHDIEEAGRAFRRITLQGRELRPAVGDESIWDRVTGFEIVDDATGQILETFEPDEWEKAFDTFVARTPVH